MALQTSQITINLIMKYSTAVWKENMHWRQYAQYPDKKQAESESQNLC